LGEVFILLFMLVYSF